jgi:hypothetical protein
MKRFLPILLLVFATSSTAFSHQPAAEPGSQAGNDEQVITQIELDWEQALLKADVATLDRIMAPEFKAGDANAFTSKADILADLKSGDYKCESMVLEDFKVVIFGDTAVTYVLETEKSNYKGMDSSGQYRGIDVYVKRNGQWRAVAAQFAKVAK